MEKIDSNNKKRDRHKLSLFIYYYICCSRLRKTKLPIEASEISAKPKAVIASLADAFVCGN